MDKLMFSQDGVNIARVLNHYEVTWGAKGRMKFHTQGEAVHFAAMILELEA